MVKAASSMDETEMRPGRLKNSFKQEQTTNLVESFFKSKRIKMRNIIIFSH